MRRAGKSRADRRSGFPKMVESQVRLIIGYACENNRDGRKQQEMQPDVIVGECRPNSHPAGGILAWGNYAHHILIFGRRWRDSR